MILKALRLAKREPSRAWLMARMATWVVVLSALAKVCSLPRALRMVSAKPQSRPGLPKCDPEVLATAIDAVLGANVFVFKSSCWKRATVLHRYLSLRGVPTSIVFGLRKEPAGALKGHAWLELEGRPILESSPPSYRVTYTYPSAERFNVELALLAANQD